MRICNSCYQLEIFILLNIVVGRRRDLAAGPGPDPGPGPVAGGEGRRADRAGAEVEASLRQGPSREDPGVAVAPARRRRKTIPGLWQRNVNVSKLKQSGIL